jgi:hypothetical protein
MHYVSRFTNYTHSDRKEAEENQIPLGSSESRFFERLKIHRRLGLSRLLCSKYRQVRLKYIFWRDPHDALIALGNGGEECV